MHNTIRRIITALTPSQACLLCLQDTDNLICDVCAKDMPRLDLQQYQQNLLNWPKVGSALGPVPYQRLLALGLYEWPLDNLLLGLKFAQKLLAARALAELFYHHALPGREDPPDAILPMPLHAERYRQRKYNQAVEIARHLGILAGIPVDTRLCVRNKATQPQTQLSGAQRRRNMRGAFTVQHPVPYGKVAVLDDVITTGASVNSLCATLLDQRPDLQIEIWVLAVSLRS
ncbi:ComF family protein [Bowmanella dokdonensis]|uniref:ComF family protein n=1 Tax=Bowmanella dokdonensis TaxID=751969 RepID=A0A939DJ36_9ALTE|nr:ComF family protein [Bowmanella dokdonensis]MBN7823623.1 ComF family protein [Bowmanella dokdonensis]